MDQPHVNDNLVLICGKSAAGKSASLMGLDNPEGVMYLNCEAGKKLPFRNKFSKYTITDPMQVIEAFDVAAQRPEVHTLAIDSLTYLMEQYESRYVLAATNTMQAWGNYAQYFKTLMQDKVANSSKNVVFMAHIADQLNESEHVVETAVPIKGSTKKNGVESYFSCILYAKKIRLADLENYQNDLLTITPEDEAVGYKHVFQTLITKDCVGEKIRSPMGMWARNETYIDNNVQFVMNRLHEYYAEDAA